MCLIACSTVWRWLPPASPTYRQTAGDESVPILHSCNILITNRADRKGDVLEVCLRFDPSC